MTRVLVVDDDRGLRRSLTLILEDADYEVRAAESGEAGLALAEEWAPELVLVDVRMPGMGGIEFVRAFPETGQAAPVIVMTAYGNMELAVEAMKAGAADYLPKPFGGDEVLLVLRKVEERSRLRREVGRLRTEVRAERRFGEIVARSPSMVRAVEVAAKVAPHLSSVLITGETGTGKELLARLIHRESERADGPFVAVNCGAIPDTLLESEFFGYVRGAFSGADEDREGLFEAANGGTLFLDEVGELPEPLQVKLLRALQEGEVRRVGATESRAVDVRVVSATNRPLATDAESGRFRSDLYYRIAVVTVAIPPLRERPEDLALLVPHLLELLASRLGIRVEGVQPDALEAIERYAWPGNVRELENVLERALVLADGPRLRVEDLPREVRRGGGGGAGGEGDVTGAAGGAGGAAFAGSDGAAGDLSVKRGARRLERDLIRRALARTGGHRGKAAQLLELSDRALRYKIREYGLDPDDQD